MTAAMPPADHVPERDGAPPRPCTSSRVNPTRGTDDTCRVRGGMEQTQNLGESEGAAQL